MAITVVNVGGARQRSTASRFCSTQVHAAARDAMGRPQVGSSCRARHVSGAPLSRRSVDWHAGAGRARRVLEFSTYDPAELVKQSAAPLNTCITLLLVARIR